MKYFAVLLAATLLPHVLTSQSDTPKKIAGDIIVSSAATDLELYAAKELQRYLYQISGSLLDIRRGVKTITRPSFVVGVAETNVALASFVAKRSIQISRQNPGRQGYILKKIEVGHQPTIVVAGSDEVGCLYGVYGLLSDYYHVGFFLGGDILPDKKSALTWVDVNEKKSPSMYIRGFLPWTNFPHY